MKFNNQEARLIELIRRIRQVKTDLRGHEGTHFKCPTDYKHGIPYSIIELIEDGEARLLQAANYLIRIRTGVDPGWEMADDRIDANNVVVYVDGEAIYKSEIEDAREGVPKNPVRQRYDWSQAIIIRDQYHIDIPLRIIATYKTQLSKPGKQLSLPEHSEEMNCTFKEAVFIKRLKAKMGERRLQKLIDLVN